MRSGELTAEVRELGDVERLERRCHALHERPRSCDLFVMAHPHAQRAQPRERRRAAEEARPPLRGELYSVRLSKHSVGATSGGSWSGGGSTCIRRRFVIPVHSAISAGDTLLMHSSASERSVGRANTARSAMRIESLSASHGKRQTVIRPSEVV